MSHSVLKAISRKLRDDLGSFSCAEFHAEEPVIKKLTAAAGNISECHE